MSEEVKEGTATVLDRRKLKLVLRRAVLLPLLLLALVSVILLVQIYRMSEASNWAAHTNAVIAEAEELHRMLLDMETGVRGYLITGNKVFLEPFENSAPKVEPALDHLDELVADNESQMERVRAIRATFMELRRHLREKVSERDIGGDYASMVDSMRGQNLMDELRDLFSGLITEESGLRDRRVNRTERAAWTAVAVVLVLTILVGGGLAWLMRRELMTLSAAYEVLVQEIVAKGEAAREAEREQGRLKEEMIRIQAARLEELSTPLIPLSQEIVLLPLIGSMDSERASRVLRTLSDGVAETAAKFAILDVTGVSTVDAHVAGVLLQASQVVRLLGTSVILTGVRPEVAQTLVSLGMDLSHITACRTLESGLRHARNLLRQEAEEQRETLSGAPKDPQHRPHQPEAKSDGRTSSTCVSESAPD